mmetsp:Transcript_117013/g.164465  ORF Transcript_117013/g.164465 Transcript_117013/m.164465 type:complete len:122 (-) Transcript_117013:227-592(-)
MAQAQDSGSQLVVRKTFYELELPGRSFRRTQSDTTFDRRRAQHLRLQDDPVFDEPEDEKKGQNSNTQERERQRGVAATTAAGPACCAGGWLGAAEEAAPKPKPRPKPKALKNKKLERRATA